MTAPSKEDPIDFVYAKARMLDDKRKHSEKKQGRKRVDPGRE